MDAGPRHGRALKARQPELTKAMCKRLVRAVLEYPSRKLACQACGVTEAWVIACIKRGTQPDAEEPYASFARDYLRAEAEVAKRDFIVFKTLVNRRGDANAMLKYMAGRYNSMNGQVEAGDLLEGTDKSTSREALFRRPPPQLQEELRQANWLQVPDHLSDEEKAKIQAIIHRSEPLPESSLDDDDDFEPDPTRRGA